MCARAKQRSSDFVFLFQIKCTRLFYIRTICVRFRISFNLILAYHVTRLSSPYPTELDINVEHRADIISTVSAHSTSWLLNGGLQAYGTLANTRIPLDLSFREEGDPQWCSMANISFSEHSMLSFPFLEWSCDNLTENVDEGCQKFEEKLEKPFHKSSKNSSRVLYDGCTSDRAGSDLEKETK